LRVREFRRSHQGGNPIRRKRRDHATGGDTLTLKNVFTSNLAGMSANFSFHA
jgi:hypothetical protein